MKRDSFIFYRSFYEAIKHIDDIAKAELLDAMCEYALNGGDVEINGVPAGMFALIKPQIDANNRKFENGNKGGRPKKKPNNNQSITKQEPNGNVNGNDNVNDNEIKTTSQKIDSDLNQVKTSKPRIKKFIPPTLEEVVEWCKTSGHNLDGDKIFHYYNDADWMDSRGKQVKNWKQKIRGVWCRDENKIVESKDMSDEDKIRDFRNLSPSQFRKKHGLQEQIRIGDIVGE